MGERVQGHKPAITPSPTPQARAVQLRKPAQCLVERGELVLELYFAEVAHQGASEFFPPPPHAAIVYDENGDTIFHQDFIEQQAPWLPGIQHSLGMRSAVRIHDERKLLACAVGRKEKQSAQQRTVFGPEVHELRGHQLIRINAPGLPERSASASHIAERQYRRREQSREIVKIVLGVGSKDGCVRSRLRLRKHLEVTAIQFDCAQMPLAVVVGISDEVNSSGIVIKAFNAENFEISFGNLILQFGVRRQGIVLVKEIEIEVSMTVAPA